jgi:hypothetical protein
VATAGAGTQLDRYCTELQTWQNQLRELYDLSDKLWRKWRIVPEEKDPNSAFLSQVRVPYTFHHVEVVVPRIIGTEPKLRYKAIDGVEDQPVAQLHTGVANWQMPRMRFKLHAKRFIRQGLVTGYSVAKTGWARDTADVTYLERATEYDDQLDTMLTVDRQRTVSDVLIKNQPFFETVNIRDFVSLRYLRKLQKLGVYSNVADVEPDSTTRLMDSRQDQWDHQGIVISDDAAANDEFALVELWERWTDEHLCAIASPFGKTVELRSESNPYWHGQKPYCDWSPIPELFQLQGMGIVHALFDLNEDLNTMRRQRSDGVAFNVIPAFKGRGIAAKALTLYPGKFFPVDELTDIEPLYQPAVDFAALERYEEATKIDMQNMSGAAAPLSGDQSSAGQAATTATGVSTITSESNKRLEEMRDEFAQRTLYRFGVQLASMNAQFMDEGTAADFSDDPNALASWVEMVNTNRPPELPPLEAPKGGIVQVDGSWLAARGRLEVIPQVGQDDELNRVQKRSDATQVVQALGPFLAMQPPAVNLEATVAYVLEQFDVPADVRAKIGDNSREQMLMQLMQVVQQQQAQLQAQQQPTMGPAANGNGSSGPSGPSGDNAPTGAVGGSPGYAG